MKIRVKYVVEDTDRHGNVRLYLRKDGCKVRLRGPLGCPDFWSDYQSAMASPPPEAKPKPGALVKGSMRWLVAEYFRSVAFKGLDPKTQATRRGILERFCAFVPEGGTTHDGEKPFAEMLPRHIRKRRDVPFFQAFEWRLSQYYVTFGLSCLLRNQSRKHHAQIRGHTSHFLEVFLTLLNPFVLKYIVDINS